MVQKLYGPALGRISPYVSLALQAGEMAVDRRWRPQAYGITYLTDGGRVAFLIYSAGDEAEDLTLPIGEFFHDQTPLCSAV